MSMQVILDSLFVRPGSAPIGGGKKGEFRDCTSVFFILIDNDSRPGGVGGCGGVLPYMGYIGICGPKG